MTAPVGVAWAPEPAHWSTLKPGDVIEVGDRLAIVAASGAHEGRRWLQTWAGDGDAVSEWAPEGGDPLALVLVRRDALVGQVLPPDPPG